MSYKNFKPRIWGKEIMRELETKSVFLEDCHRKYEGEVKAAGDSVKLVGIGKVTVTETVGGGRIVLDAPETVEDTSVTLYVNRVAKFNYTVGDIDKLQAVGGIMEALSAESSEGIAGKIDASIADLAKDKLANLLNKTTTTLTADNVLDIFNDAQVALLKNDVSMNTELVVVVPPWLWMLVRDKLIYLDTNNSGRIKNPTVGKYGMLTFKCSNRVATDGSADYVMVRTKRAIASVVAKTHTEPYRPEDGFEDAVKGFSLYGSKIQRPKEMVVCKVAQSTTT